MITYEMIHSPLEKLHKGKLMICNKLDDAEVYKYLTHILPSDNVKLIDFNNEKTEFIYNIDIKILQGIVI